MNWFKNTKKPYGFEFIVVILSLLFLYLTYFYTDVAITTRSGIDFWTYLFQGNITHFYDLSKNMTFYDTLHCDALYDFTIYIIFAIWDFPLWVIEQLTHIDALYSTGCLLWAKGIMLPFLAGTYIYIKKIGRLLGFSKEKNLWCGLIYLSSTFIMSSIFVLCQYDIIGIFFSLIGLYYYIKKDMTKFTLYMAVAVTMKTFALFIFLPLLLLRVKNAFKILGYTIGSLSVFLVSQIFFSLLGTTPAGSFLFAQMNKMLMGTVTLGLGNASIFIMVYLGILLFCYMKHIDSDYELGKFAIYLPFAVWSCFFVFSESSPYWIILLTPYFALMACQNTKLLKVNLLLDALSGIGLVLAQNLFFPWVFSYEWIMALMPFSKIFHPIPEMIQENNLLLLADEATIQSFTNTFGLPVCLGLFAFANLALMYLNFPKANRTMAENKKNINDFSEELTVERSVIWLRFLSGFGVCMVPFFFFLLDMWV